MGNKVSVVHGVKSADFYHQGNAINEIWIGDVELVSRLPFGDSDLGQAGWPEGSWPKIPWHQFIIPLKRSIDTSNATIMAANETTCTCPPSITTDWPDTGIIGLYKSIPKGPAFALGVILLITSISLFWTPARWRTLIRSELLVYQRLRVRVRPPGYLACEITVRGFYWMASIFTYMMFGLTMFVFALPLALWGVQDLTASEFACMAAFVAVSVSGFSALYQFIWVAFLHRRTLAVHKKIASMDEKTTEDDIPEVTIEEYWERVGRLKNCPHCERNCSCKVD